MNPNARPLWIGDLANQILAEWDSWDQEAGEAATAEQNSDVSQYVVLSRLEEAIDKAWRKARNSELCCLIGGFSAAAELHRIEQKLARSEADIWFHRGKADAWEVATKNLKDTLANGPSVSV